MYRRAAEPHAENFFIECRLEIEDGVDLRARRRRKNSKTERENATAYSYSSPKWARTIRAFKVLERAEILDDVAAGVIEEQLAVLRAADRDDPFEIVPVFKQIIDGLRHPAARDNRNLRPGSFSFSCLGIFLINPLAGRMRESTTQLH